MNGSLSLILVAVACGIGGQVTLKMGMTQVGRIDAEALAAPLDIAIKVVTSPMVVGGLVLYGLGAVAWLAVLSRLPLSFAYPFLALSYALTPVLAWLLLGENIPSLRWMGIATIFLGVILVSRG